MSVCVWGGGGRGVSGCVRASCESVRSCLVVGVCLGGVEGGEADHGQSATCDEKPSRRKNGNSEPQSFDLSRPLFPEQLQQGALREGTGEREGKVAAVRERKQGLRPGGLCSFRCCGEEGGKTK